MSNEKALRLLTAKISGEPAFPTQSLTQLRDPAKYARLSMKEQENEETDSRIA
jgi:hypothetical protein